MRKREFSNVYIIKITESLSNAQWQQNAKQKVKSYTFTKKQENNITYYGKTPGRGPEKKLWK